MANKVTQEYAKTLKRYMKKFHLSSVDIVYLAKSTNKNNITALLEKRGGVTLETSDNIAQIFGFRYYEFGIPNHPLPSYNSLPEKTKERILFRKKAGPPAAISYTQLNLNEKIIVILSTLEVHDTFLASSIAARVNQEFAENIGISQIIDRFKKAFVPYVARTNNKDMRKIGAGAKPFYYKLIQKIPKEVLAEAIAKFSQRSKRAEK